MATSHFSWLRCERVWSDGKGRFQKTDNDCYCQNAILGTKIPVNIYENTEKKAPLIFVSLHHNEQLGLGLVKEAIKANGGKLIEIVSVGQNGPLRNIHFAHEGRVLCVDPNRIFSEDGIKTSLSYDSFGEGCENVKDDGAVALTKLPKVISAIRNFRTELFRWIFPNKMKYSWPSITI